MSRKLIERIGELSSPLTPLPTGHQNRLKKLSGIRSVVFDVYGTLFISGSGDIGTSGTMNEAEAFARATEATGFSLLQGKAGREGSKLLVERIRSFHGKQKEAGIEYPEIDILSIFKDTLRILVRNGLIVGKITPGAVERASLEYECRVNPTWPMPGLEGTLKEIARRNLILGIISNAQFYTPLLFPAFLGRSHRELGFEICIWSYQVGEAKPSQALFLKALAALERSHGILPREVLYVGNDMLNDIRPAFLTGCRTALFAGDGRSLRIRAEEPLCSGLEPDAVLTGLAQIVEVLA